MIIAIDGPAASGKGTLARRIAAHFVLSYLDTGSLYRAVARDVMAADGDLLNVDTVAAAARTLDPDSLADPFLRDRGVGEAASIVARVPAVRDALLDYQRWYAHRKVEGMNGAVLDGRDIGTVVCPDADVKLFVTAEAEERANRRYHELRAKGFEITRDSVMGEIKARDQRDLNRDVAPMRASADALLLDTTDLDIEQAFTAAVDLIDKTLVHQPKQP